jgi:hypothetical protein
MTTIMGHEKGESWERRIGEIPINGGFRVHLEDIVQPRRDRELWREANIKNKTINGPTYGRNLVRVNDADYRIPPLLPFQIKYPPAAAARSTCIWPDKRKRCEEIGEGWRVYRVG